jgi:hypothetical protein
MLNDLMKCTFEIIQKQMDHQQGLQQGADKNVYLMNMFKEHLKLTCKIIIDDIYDNYWSYMKKYTN